MNEQVLTAPLLTYFDFAIEFDDELIANSKHAVIFDQNVVVIRSVGGKPFSFTTNASSTHRKEFLAHCMAYK